jgi:hypothetical protein
VAPSTTRSHYFNKLAFILCLNVFR